MMKMQQLRDSLISEARNSPMLLSDLAGLESYVSESYNCRTFIELLQNADDACASEFFVKRQKNYLIVANNGRPFNISDLESLCRSASSKKVRGETIGYRGIGFKSVVSFAQSVHLISGDFEITFSKDLSKQLVPQAPIVPLIRIPHPIDPLVKKDLLMDIEALQRDGFNTIFVFSGSLIDLIEDEYTSFSQTTLLFLNSIRSIRIFMGKNVTASVNVERDTESGRRVRVTSIDGNSDWLVCSDSNCSIAFNVIDGHIERLARDKATIHAFLPTEDKTGLGVVVNGDFSTDPSRRHLILDGQTKGVIMTLARLYSKLLRQGLTNANSEMVRALMPYFDIKLVQLIKPSFEKELSLQIKKHSEPFFSKLRLAPSWFNNGDFNKIVTQSLPVNCNDIPELNGVLLFLGSKRDEIDSLLRGIGNFNISLIGYSQLAVNGMKSLLMNRKLSAFLTSPIFLSRGRLCSLSDIEKEGHVIDDSFLQLMLENGIQKREIELCLNKLKLVNLQTRLFSNRESDSSQENDESNSNSERLIDWFNNVSETELKVQNTSSFQKWRSAEENALNIFNENGFKLEDVSTLNYGYDLEGLDPNGNNIFIEIKSVDYAGQKFRMTNNEFASAQYKQDSYYIAIVLQRKDYIEISLIKNPVKNLKMTRVCVQWVWECPEYNYRPMIFKL